MLKLIKQFMASEQNKRAMADDPVLRATVMALYQYIEAGNRLSDLPWFKGIDFGDLENRLNLQKAA